MLLVIFYMMALFIGAFMNDVIDHFADRMNHQRNRGQCSYCAHALQWYDRIPILSYLSTHGKCRYCKRKLPIRYPLVEISAAANFLFVCEQFDDQIQGLYFYIFLCLMLVLAILDIMFKKVPLIGVYLIAILGIASALTTDDIVLLDRVCAIFLVSFPLWALSKVKKNSIGKGDILFCASTGFLLGMWGIVFTVCLAYIFGGIYAVIMLCLHKLDRQSRVAMFPFFYMAAALFLGSALNFIQITLR